MVHYCYHCLWRRSDDDVNSVSIGVWPIVWIFLRVLVVVVAEMDSVAVVVSSKSQAGPCQVVGPSYPVVVAFLAVGPFQEEPSPEEAWGASSPAAAAVEEGWPLAAAEHHYYCQQMKAVPFPVGGAFPVAKSCQVEEPYQEVEEGPSQADIDYYCCTVLPAAAGEAAVAVAEVCHRVVRWRQYLLLWLRVLVVPLLVQEPQHYQLLLVLRHQQWEVFNLQWLQKVLQAQQ